MRSAPISCQANSSRLFAAELDPITGTVSCIRAGHHPAVMVSADGDTVLRKVGRQGMAIGLAAGPIFAGSMHADVVHMFPAMCSYNTLTV